MRALGLLLVMSPLLVLGVVIAHFNGWRVALGILGVAVLGAAVVTAGAFLLAGGVA